MVGDIALPPLELSQDYMDPVLEFDTQSYWPGLKDLNILIYGLLTLT